MTKIRKRSGTKKFAFENEMTQTMEYSYSERNKNCNDSKNNECKSGTLVSIELENWMNIKGPTKYYFNQGVNMITGLNGSGKSSVACGIAISLGYDTHILARGNFLSSYIRNGNSYCKLTIEIANETEIDNDYISVIERTINMVNCDKIKLKSADNHSEIRSLWKLNGKRSLEKEIIQLRTKLNIQLDNMLTFLAQQRVSYFPTQTPKQIFIETLKIISNKNTINCEDTNLDIEITEDDFKTNNLLKIYNKFIEISNNSKDCNVIIQDNNLKLNHLENEISKSKKNELKYIQYLKNKMALELINFYKSLNDIKVDKITLNKLNKEKKEIINQYNKINKELQMLITENDRINNELSRINIEKSNSVKEILSNLGNEYKSAMNSIDRSLNYLKNNIVDPKTKLENYNIMIKNKKEEIENSKKLILNYKSSIDSEWVNKLKECKLYLEDGTLFDIELAKEKRRLLGENISDLSTKILKYERLISEHELNINRLRDKKGKMKIDNKENNIKDKSCYHFKNEYLNNVNKMALSQIKKDNIIKFLRLINSNSNISSSLYNNTRALPSNNVIGPIGSYIIVENSNLQSLVEYFLQQFHYYFISERDDVKLLTEKHKLNVITLSNSKEPVHPKIDNEVKSLGIEGFLHEYLTLNNELIRNVLYQISPQFYTCAIIENPELAPSTSEDEILYKLSDWFKKKYDKQGSIISNNIYLFINSKNSNGTLYRLVSSIYNNNSKTISMIRLNNKMNTILTNNLSLTNGSDKNITKSELSNDFLRENELIDLEINKLNIEIEKTKKEFDLIKNEYNDKRAQLNMLLECITNIPSIKDKISKLEKNIEVLNNELNMNCPVIEDIVKKNKEHIRKEIIGSGNNNSILKMLDSMYILFLDISKNKFKQVKELNNDIEKNNNKLNQIQVQIKTKKDNLRSYENRKIELNDEYDNTINNLNMKREIILDYYLQFYSTFYLYIKRYLCKNDLKDKNVFEYVYNKDNIYNFNENDCNHTELDIIWKNVPGVDYVTSILNNNNNFKIKKIPDYCVEIIYEISSEYELISNVDIDLNQVLLDTCKTKDSMLGNEESDGSKIRSLFDLLLDNSTYKKKYDNLFNEILKLEGKTHETNLERLAELEQEYEILKKSSKNYMNKINLYKNNIKTYYDMWLNKLKLIEKTISYCFCTFMKFINYRHDGKVIIPFIDNFSEFESNENNNVEMNVENNIDLLFDYFTNKFESDSIINIMVRFGPDEDLRLFSSNSISGGEQSLCTILYILSLQVCFISFLFKFMFLIPNTILHTISN
ncbi:hypothetical protein FG386_002762 [Cryptosporidium ryanae]|uniref:uncharacterized protein n=1 Tax=Cryptosporidium ryanae TaxID=515981 RepID=UPI00351A5210|nr:hypothetical protein FG386_002762 [Cryptosporidium ryanae]